MYDELGALIASARMAAEVALAMKTRMLHRSGMRVFLGTPDHPVHISETIWPEGTEEIRRQCDAILVHWSAGCSALAGLSSGREWMRLATEHFAEVGRIARELGRATIPGSPP